MTRKSVLVVDDNPTNLRIARLTLETGGFVVREAPDAVGALTILAGWTPDVVVVDLRMPGTDGHSLLQAIRDIPALHAVPVIAMSAYDAPSEARITALGFSGFIGKPMSPSEFCQHIERLIGASS
jgi:two-component system cell cycle response regulator DivK